jgi:hypothetical protein
MNSPITKDEIFKGIKNLKNNKAFGDDQVIEIKKFLNSISDCLVDFPVFKIFQYSLGSFFRKVFICLDISLRCFFRLLCTSDLCHLFISAAKNTFGTRSVYKGKPKIVKGDKP